MALVPAKGVTYAWRHARRDLETRHAALQPQLLKRAATLQAKGAPQDPALHRFLSTPISGAPCAAFATT